MESRFGLKDFVLMVLVLGVGITVVLAMVQDDRKWNKLSVLESEMKRQSSTLGDIKRALENGVVSMPSSGSALYAGSSGKPLRDESWARPGAVVTWPEPWGPASDPTQFDDYARGGTLTEIFEGIPKKLTPFTLNDVYISRVFTEVVCESLAMYASDDLQLQGWLAEAWQYDPDGMWLRVKIHDAARFSDGMPVTAEDVRYTYMDYIFNPEIESQEYVAQVENVKDVHVISEKVVEFEFVKPAFDNLVSALRFPIIPKHYYEQFTPSQINQSTGLLIGSGPWRFEQTPTPENQWTPPQPIVLVRNENYWRDPPPIDSFRYTFIQNNTARLTAFDNGDGDIMRATPNQHSIKSEDPNWLAHNHALAWPNMRSGYAIIAWNCGERNGRATPFADKRVRLAMTHLLDRRRINRDFYEGLAVVATGPFPPGQGDPTIEHWPYDVDRARELLNEAGWVDRDGDGRLENERGDEFIFEFIHTTGSSVGPKIAKYMSDQGQKVGISVKVRIVDWSMIESIRDARDFDSLIQAWSWTSPEDDPYQLFHSSQIANQGDNWIQYSNPEADRVMDLAKTTIDFDTRAELWAEFHRIMHDDQPYMFLLQVPWIRFVSGRVKNVHTYPVGFNKWEMYIPVENQR